MRYGDAQTLRGVGLQSVHKLVLLTQNETLTIMVNFTPPMVGH